MSDNNIDLTATFDTSKATNSIKEFGSAAEKSIVGLDDSFYKINQSIDKTSNNKLKIDTSNATSSLDSLKTGLMAVGATVAAYFTVNAISGFFSTIIDESIDAENNLNQLNGAMQRTGEYTAANVESMNSFSTAMAAVSTIDDDVINGQLALALNFTKSTESAQGLVKAAMDLSAATGISLDQAVEQLGKTLDGTAGRLNETVPALRGLSEEALKAGEGIKVVGEAFAGAATNQLNTFQGAVEQTKNNLGNLLATFGSFITQNPMVIQAINEISRAFGFANTAVGENNTEITSFVNNGIVSLITGIRSLLPQLNTFASFLKAIATIFEILGKGIMSFVDTLKILGNAWLWLVGTLEGKKTALSGIEEAIARVNKRADELTKSLQDVGKDAFTKVNLKELEDALKRIQDAAKKGVKIDAKLNIDDDNIKGVKDKINAELGDITKNIQIDLDIPELKPEEPGNPFTRDQLQEMGFQQWFNNLSDYLDDFILKYNEPKDKEQQSAWEGQFKEGASLPEIEPIDVSQWEKVKDSLTATASYIWNVMPGVKGIAYLGTKAVWNLYDTIRDNAEMYAAALGNGFKKSIDTIISSSAQGAEGAKGAVSSIIADLAAGAGNLLGAMFGPMGAQIGGAIGGTIGEMIKIAPGDKKQIEAKLNEFFDAIPKVVENIVDNLPMIAEKVMGELPSVMVRLMEAIPKIIMAFANSMDELAEGLIMNSPALVQLMLELPWIIIKAATVAAINVVRGIASGLSRLIKEKLDEANRVIFEKINAAVKSVTQFFDGISNFFKSLSYNDIGLGLKNQVTGLYEGAIVFLTKIGDALGAIWNFFASIPTLLWVTVKSIWDFFASIPSLLWGSIKTIWDFFVSIPTLLWDAVMSVWDFFASIPTMLYDAIKGIFDIKVGGSGEGGLISGTGTILDKLATGGVVPKGYPNDSYPALLTSGETVVRAESADNLFNLIDNLASGGNAGSQNMDETNKLLRQLIALIASQETQVDVKLDRNTLAKAILTLNQDNRRLA